AGKRRGAGGGGGGGRGGWGVEEKNPWADEPAPPGGRGRGPVAPPHPAVFAREAVVVLARIGRPGAHAALGAAHFDDALSGRMMRDAPIETVAAQIHQAAALA